MHAVARLTVFSAVAALVVGACSRRPAVDTVPVGSDVQLTRTDGALVEGKLLSRDADTVKLDVGPSTKAVPRADIADMRVRNDDADEPPKTAKFREIEVPADTPLTIRLETALGSATSARDTAVRGEVTEPVVVKGRTAITAGANVTGAVTAADPSGKVKGLARLAFSFTDLSMDGAHYPISARFDRTAAATKTKDAETIGIPAAGGAIIGAIVGGGNGAAIGAAAGGGAGTAVVVATPGRNITLERGTVLRLDAGKLLTVRVPIANKP
jgi:hypothetical protein